MARSPLEDTAVRWGQRFQQAQAAGIDVNKIRPIAQYDIQRVMRGGTGLNNMQANLAILAGGVGKSLVGDPQKKTSSPLDILGNIPSDIGHIVMGFVPGMVRAAVHLPSEISQAAQLAAHGGPFVKTAVAAVPGNPFHIAALANIGESDTQSAKWLQQHGYEGKGVQFSPTGLAASLRNMANGPEGSKTISLYGLVPGLTTAARLTTPAGREQIRQQPVGTALDVMPVAAAAGRALTAGRIAEVGSATEALQAGRPVKALARAIPAEATPSILTDTGLIRRANLAERTRGVVQSIGMDPMVAEKLIRPYSVTTRKLHGDVMKFFKGTMEPIVEQFSPEERAQLFDEATHYHPYGKLEPDGKITPISPEHHAVIQYGRRINEMMADVGQDRGSLVRVPGPDNKTHIYSTSSTVAKQYQKVNGLADKVAKATDPAKQAKFTENLLREQKRLATRMINNPPASFHGAIESKVRTGAEELARTQYQGQSLTNALRDISESTSWQDFGKIVGEKEFSNLVKDSMTSWVEMSKMGLDPLWMHHVPEERFGRMLYPKPLPDQYTNPSSWRDKAFNFAPHMHDIAVAITDTGVDVLRADATRRFVDETVMPLTINAGEVKSALREVMRARYHDPESLAAAVDQAMKKQYRRFDPANPFSGDKILTGHDNDVLLPKHVDQALDGLMGAQRRLPVKGLWDKSMNVFKFSVLTGPRHLVHVGLGGMMFGMLREPGLLRQLPAAFKIAKAQEIPVELPQSLYGLETDQLFKIASGKTMARHFVESVGDKAKALAHFEEFISNVERTATYLSAAKRGLDHEAALQVAQKTFVDLDNLMPVERYLLKQVFPFYAFTRHLFKYLLSYPVDHPIRASVLSKFAENEMEEWKSGLPLKYQHMFFLGDPKSDVQTAVDFKSINPFRSFSDQFTLAGFVQSLNPAASTIMQSAGINTVTGVPELYPDTEYNPETGTVQAKRKNFAMTALNAYIPETQALQAVLGQSDQLRQLRQTNPEAYRRAMFNFLNLPFAFGDVSMSQVKAKAEVNRYNAAQKAVSSAMMNGNWEEAKKFKLVPFRGQLVPPDQLEQMWSQLQLQTGQVNPKAIIPPYRGTSRR